MRSLLSLTIIVGSLCASSLLQADDKPLKSKNTSPRNAVLVKVNGESITQADLERVFLLRAIPENMRSKVKDQLIGQLIDARLMRQYLQQQKVTVPDSEVDKQIQRLESMLQKRPEAKQILQNLADNKRTLREEIAVPLMWKVHTRKTVTDGQITDFFEQHREELDGTKLRVSHILLKAPLGTSEEESVKLEQQLASLREEIVAGRQTFEQAAEKNSQAPSAPQGGDIGLLQWEGIMPESFCQVAFKLPLNEVSPPFRTHFGWHLCVVKEKIPGDLTVEDARSDILSRLSQQMWEQKLEQLRTQAKIEPASN